MSQAEPLLRAAIKERPEDFEVEEIPAYEPSGEGTHRYLWIEKRGVTTFDLIRSLGRVLSRPRRDFGYAGLKDARAVTRQWISIEHVEDERLLDLEIPGARVLDMRHHGNKLKVGHLHGNRFRILLRGAEGGCADPVRKRLRDFAENGLPNTYGAQRFGREGDNDRLGKLLVFGEHAEFLREWIGAERPEDEERARARELFRAEAFDEALGSWPRSLRDERPIVEALTRGADAEAAVRRVPRQLRQLLVSALQSRLFNEVLQRRRPDLHRLEVGDIAFLHRNGACFVVEDLASEQERADAFEISPSGPIFGSRMLEAVGEPGRLEATVLEAAGLTTAQFGQLGGGLDQKGARRPLRVPVNDPSVEVAPEGLWVGFALGKGVYATTLLEEILEGGAPEASLPQ